MSEGEVLEDLKEDATTTGFVCVGEHGRQGLHIGQRGQQDLASGGGELHRPSSSSSPQHRGGNNHSKEMVVMRKLALSERRDSFKKQEAVQEVSFDDTEEREPPPPVVVVVAASPTPPVTVPKAFKASWTGSAAAQTGEKAEGRGSQVTPAQQKAKSKEKQGF